VSKQRERERERERESIIKKIIHARVCKIKTEIIPSLIKKNIASHTIATLYFDRK